MLLKRIAVLTVLAQLVYAALPRQECSRATPTHGDSPRSLLQHTRSQSHGSAIPAGPPLFVVSHNKSKDIDAGSAVSRVTPLALDPLRDALHKHLDHHSIFQLRFEELDKTMFWIILAAMLLFTVIIDRVQAFAAYHAQDSKTEQMFLNRINAELLMFGCVGIFLFLIENILTLPQDQAVLIEFVDILCSFGACNLIMVAAMLLLTRVLFRRIWKGNEKTYLDATEIVLSERAWANGLWSGPREYQFVAQRFREINKLRNEFTYYHYLNECLARNACHLMDVHWTVWVIFFLGSLFFLAYSYVRHGHPSSQVYLLFFTIANWLTLVGFLAIILVIHYGNNRLVAAILDPSDDKVEEETSDDEESSGYHPMGRHWGTTVSFLMQSVSLTNSFLFSFYVMHLHYNITAEGKSTTWLVMLLVPQLVNVTCLMPIMVTYFTVVESFCSPDRDALDSVLQRMSQLEEDLTFFRTIWISNGKPSVPPGMTESYVDEEGLALVLQAIGLHASSMRVHRLFKEFDQNEDGTVDAQEIITRLSQEQTAKTPPGSLAAAPVDAA